MKKIAFGALLALLVLIAYKLQPTSAYPENTVGRIVIDVAKNGEAWYVYPKNKLRYYLGRPADAFAVMRKLGLGAKHALIAETGSFPDKLSGMILLDVEQNGEAYYINPADHQKYYMGRPADAFALMRRFGLGISGGNLATIPAGNIGDPQIAPMPDNLKDVGIKFVNQSVPFLAQAPFGDWADERQQDGCEEASAIMAVAWARGETAIDKQAGLDEILDISAYEQKNHGEFRDVSTADALDWIYKGYFNFKNVERKTDVSLDDMISALEAGKVLVVPANGQALGNPYFTAPGPVHHMLLVRGYDPATGQFIANDPGTRHGELYRYRKDVLYNAIRDYETGSHLPDAGSPKNILVISK